MTPAGQRAGRGRAAGPRTILVTGGANGAGAAMVRRFTAAGHQVSVADTDLTAGRELAAATGCLFVATDVGVFAGNQAAVRETAGRFGGLDAVCLNAGPAGQAGELPGHHPQPGRR